jgi:recombination protein RecT
MGNLETVKKDLQNMTPLQSVEKMMQDSVSKMGQAIPKHMNVQRLNRIVISLIKTTPQLQDCTPISIVGGVFSMAQVGLEPIDGQAYLLPYNNKQTKKKEAQFQIGYKGWIALFYRHASSLAIFGEAIHTHDSFTHDAGKGELTHTWDLKKPRGRAYGYWIKAKLKNGAEIIKVMSKDEILEHAKKHSKAWNKKDKKFYFGPWVTEFDSMALKTVLIQIMKFLPKSVEMQNAIALDETTKKDVSPDMASVPDQTDYEDGPVLDAEVTETTPVAPVDMSEVKNKINGGGK